MPSRLVRITLATTAAALTLGLAGCSNGASVGDAADAQEARNQAVEELAAARHTTLIPVATQIELLQRAEFRARLAEDAGQAKALGEQVAEYTSLATAIRSASTPEAVHSLVEQAGLDLG
jgi:hypothetical protein